VELSPVGALTFYFDPVAALGSAARLAAAVMDARDLEHGNEILHGLGVYTELDYERDAVHTGSGPGERQSKGDRGTAKRSPGAHPADPPG
jgi:hypothetical protein